jgi:hypothetical protein
MQPSSRLLLALLAPFLVAGAVQAQESKDEKDLKRILGDRDGSLRLRVNEAIRSGSAWLKKQQNPDGSWTCVWAKFAPPNQYPMGETALSLLALLKSGVPPGSECVTRGFAWLRQQPLKKTYEVGVLLMALEALCCPATDPAGPRPRTAPAKPVNVPGNDLDWMRECVEFLLANRVSSQRALGSNAGEAKAAKDIWHYPRDAGDHSNTQFALLGLKSASRCGIPVPPEVWIATLKHFLEVQEKNGPKVLRQQLADAGGDYEVYTSSNVQDTARGWCYAATLDPKGDGGDELTAATGSMTCVGVSSVAIALSELGHQCPPDLEKPGRKAIWDGIAWLARHWSVEENPRHPQKRWHYYYLYGLERTGVLTWQRTFGRNDWYRRGAEWLVAGQKGDHWDDPLCAGPVNNTCFALLFLTRATVPGEPVITGR